MSKERKTVLLVSFLILALLPVLSGKEETPSILSMRERNAVVNNWLKIRLETVLPELMRREKFDMWVVICREYNDPEHATANAYFSKYLSGSRSPLMSWLVFLTMGAALGGLFSAFIANRIKGEVARGPSIGVSARLWLALGGGILSGFAARLARGCTSGQALTGAAELAFGSWIFMFSIFAGAYATAYFFRKEWL